MTAEPTPKRPRVAPAAGPEKIIIDTDPGVDDVWALCLALASPEELEILGVTIVGGGNCANTRQMAQNAGTVLHLAGRDDIKVVEGAITCLTGADRGLPGALVHGENGIGNVELPSHAISLGPKHGYRSAADFLIETCEAQPGMVTIVALGPLTNIAEALRRSPKFAASVKRIVMMGGSVPGGQIGKLGNKTPVAEANIFNDPEAAKLVFARFPDIVMAGLNVTCQLDCCEWRDRVRELNEAGRFLHAISEHYVEFLLTRPDRPIPVHDSCAMLWVIRPELFTETRRVCVDVETKGELTTGQTVADWYGRWQKTAQTTILLSVDTKSATELFCDRIARLKFPDLGVLTRRQGSL